MSTPLYFIECRLDRTFFWCERDANEMDRETTIRDIIAGQVENPVRVIEVIADEFSARDVSEDFAREIAARVQTDPISASLVTFIDQHAGTALALEMRAA